jgi:transcriptional regulator with XRE-family HTH domain
MKHLDTRLKKLRLEAGLSQQELGRRSQVSVAFISKLESGTYSSLGLDKCHQLAVGLGLTLHDFLAGIGMLEDTSTPKTVEALMFAMRKEKKLTSQQTQQAIEYIDFLSMQNKP